MLRRAKNKNEKIVRLIVLRLVSLAVCFAHSPAEFGLVLSMRHVNVEVEGNHR